MTARRCHWPTCAALVPHDRSWCDEHWRCLPVDVRHALRHSFPGSREHSNAMREADELARSREGMRRRYVPDNEIPGMPRL